MTDEEKRIAGYDMLYLVRCALQGVTAEPSRLSGTLSAAFHMAKFHSLASLCSYALGGAWDGENEAYRAFCHAKDHTVMKNAMFDIERGELLQFCEASGIRYMPLKGILIKEMYPNAAMRQMADNDIWYDKAHQKEIAAWFAERGYHTEIIGKSNHDVFYKKPFFNFEMHTAMYDKLVTRPWHRYYEERCKHLLPTEGTKFGVHFSDEDFYVYVVSHAQKHHEGGGTGLRSLTDLYLMARHFNGRLDREYVEREMKKLGIADFEREALSLADTIFSSDAMPEGQAKEMLESIFRCGTYGNLGNRVKNTLEKMSGEKGRVTAGTRMKYLFRRLFPPREQMRELYGAKNAFLLPFSYVRRFFSQCIPNGKRIRSELRALFRREDAHKK